MRSLLLALAFASSVQAVSLNKQFSATYYAEALGRLGHPSDSVYMLENFSETELMERSYVFNGILEAHKVTRSLSRINSAMETDTSTKLLISSIDFFYSIMDDHGVMIADNWGRAIEYKIKLPHYYCDFSTALNLILGEFKRLELDSKIATTQQLIKSRVATLDKSSKILDLYIVALQMQKLASNPEGSLTEFKSSISDLRREYRRAKAISDLE